jgi:Glycosyltransferase family 87
MSAGRSCESSAVARASIRDLVIFSGLFFALSAVAYFATISWIKPIPLDATTLAVGRDFLNFWMYGHAAAIPDPGQFYNPAVYNRELAALVGADYPGQNWSYPPNIMLIAAPFARLPYMAALIVWTVLSLAIFLVVMRGRIGDRRLLIPVLFSPAAVLCLMSGQSAFITAAMLITIFACLDRRPVLSGVLIGLLTMKPQLGLLLPVMLVAAGRWRTFAAAAVTAIAVAGLTAALFGPKVWIDFLLTGIPAQNLVLVDPEMRGAPFMPTIFMNMRVAGASYGLAMAVQGCFSAFAAAAVFWVFRFRRTADPLLLMATYFACAIFGSPYLLAYDTMALTIVAVMLLASDKLDARGRVLAKLVFWLPLVQLAFGFSHVPGPALITPVFAIYALIRLRDVTDWGRPALVARGSYPAPATQAFAVGAPTTA